MSGIVSGLLYQDFPQATSIGKEIAQYGFIFIGPIMLLATIVEFFRKMDFGTVVVKTFIAIAVVCIAQDLHKKMSDWALEESSSFVSKLAENRPIIKMFELTLEKAVNKKDSAAVNEKMAEIWAKNIKYVMGDVFAQCIWAFCLLIIFLLKQIYSIVYHFTYIFYPVCALLSILPVSSNALDGAIKGTFWCILMPFILIVMLVLIATTLTTTDATTGEYTVSTMGQMVQLLIACLMLIATPMITYKMIDGTGFASVASSLSSAGVNAATMYLSKPMKLGHSKATDYVSGAAMKGASFVGGKTLGMASPALRKGGSFIAEKTGLGKNISDPYKNDYTTKRGLMSNIKLPQLSQLKKASTGGVHGSSHQEKQDIGDIKNFGSGPSSLNNNNPSYKSDENKNNENSGSNFSYSSTEKSANAKNRPSSDINNPSNWGNSQPVNINDPSSWGTTSSYGSSKQSSGQSTNLRTNQVADISYTPKNQTKDLGRKISKPTSVDVNNPINWGSSASVVSINGPSSGGKSTPSFSQNKQQKNIARPIRPINGFQFGINPRRGNDEKISTSKGIKPFSRSPVLVNPPLNHRVGDTKNV